MKYDKTTEDLKKSSSWFEKFAGCVGCLFILFLAWAAVVAFIEKIFPNFKSLPGYAYLYISFIVLVLVIIFASFFLSHLSDNKDIYIPVSIKLFIGIGLLALIYWVYPEGITDIPISSVKVGEIGRLVIVLVSSLAFLVDMFLVIVDIRDLF